MARTGGGLGPAGGEVLRRTKAALARGWPAGLTVLTGDDAFHLDRAEEAILERLVPPPAPEFALTVFGGRRVDVAEVLAGARSRGMFASRRVVLVMDVEALQGDPQAISAYASDPPTDSYVVVRAPKLDLRRPIQKALASADRLLRFSLEGRGAAESALREIHELAARRRLSLDRDAAELLLRASSGDLYGVSTELDKLRSWVGGEAETRITPGELRQLSGGAGGLHGWEVADAVLARDAAAALRAARELVDSGEEPLRILGGLAWRSRVMLQAKALVESGPRGAERALRLWAGVPHKALLSGVERYSLDELLAFPSHLLRTDRALKSRGIPPRALLESLAEALTGKAGAGPGDAS